jgi:hypothetical protein
VISRGPCPSGGTRALRDPNGRNVATGSLALNLNDASDNTATGFQALEANTSANFNVADGVNALVNATGSSIAVGADAGANLTTGSNNIDIGNGGGNAAESKTMRIGTKGNQTRTFVAGISGKTVSGTGTPVVVNAQGQLGTASAASAAASAKVGNSDRRLRAKVSRLQRAVRQLRAEVKRGH